MDPPPNGSQADGDDQAASLGLGGIRKRRESTRSQNISPPIPSDNMALDPVDENEQQEASTGDIARALFPPSIGFSGLESGDKHLVDGLKSSASSPGPFRTSPDSPSLDCATPPATVSPAGEPRAAKPLERVRFRSYLWSEVMGGYFDSPATPESLGLQHREDVYNFFAVPRELERILLYGFLICLDTFLFLFTFFPIRIAYALGHVCKKLFFPRSTGPVSSSEIYDLLRGLITLLCYFGLTATDASVMYHFIRGQAAIKLYVIFNVLEIFDRLCCSFGQDILDSLFCLGLSSDARTNESETTLKKFSPIMSVLIAAVYVFFHSFLLFIKVVTLNAAVNAYNNALLTLLVSNNFVELKGSVFKNFKEENLFQITCSDMVERFQLFISLAIVLSHNLNDISWSLTRDTLEAAASVFLTVWGMEVLVDWIKHAFITKFNRIDANVYSKFSRIIATEIVKTKRQSIPDTSHNISRRIGFVPLPLACVVLKVFLTVAPISGVLGILWLLALWASLCVLKVITTLLLLGKSLKRLEADQARSAAVDGTAKRLANIFAYEKI